MFQRDRVPPLINMDGFQKKQTMGQFRVKAREPNCQLKQSEQYSPWQNASESVIKMAVSKCLQRIWDHCIELEAMIWLQGLVPETIVSGKATDISPFIEYAWFDWIIYDDLVVSFLIQKNDWDGGLVLLLIRGWQ
jgi:hypothetical protein